MRDSLGFKSSVDISQKKSPKFVKKWHFISICLHYFVWQQMSSMTQTCRHHGALPQKISILFVIHPFRINVVVTTNESLITSTLAIKAKARKKAIRRPKNGLYRNKVIWTCVRKPWLNVRTHKFLQYCWTFTLKIKQKQTKKNSEITVANSFWQLIKG